MKQSKPITTIAFDADDTLWHNERIFLDAKNRYKSILERYHEPEWVEERLDEAEIRNIRHFGYGVKGFTLSMIETAVELTEGRINGNEIGQIVKLAKNMLDSPIELLDGVKETIDILHGSFKLMVVTKGDLFDQETKIARSGLGELFSHVEIVSKKDKSVYEFILKKLGIENDEFVMVGNSLRSDILPVLELGSNAVHVPYETEWFHDRVEKSALEQFEFDSIGSLPLIIDWLNKRQS